MRRTKERNRFRPTAAQRTFLENAKRYSVPGKEIFGDEARTASALERAGMIRVTMPGSGAPWGRAYITDAGREAIFTLTA